MVTPTGGWPDCETPRGACPNSAHPWRCWRSVPCSNQTLAMALDLLHGGEADAWVQVWVEKWRAGEPLHPALDPNWRKPVDGDE